MTAFSLRTVLRSDVAFLIACAIPIVVLHFWTGSGYGFHRDELQFLDDARHLHWGFVAYPPMTAFCGRIAIELFGISPQVFRLPAALVNALSLVLTGLIARELGGRRPAQAVALVAAFPAALVFSSVLQYNTFDMLAWNLLVLFTARVLRSDDDRNWLGAGLGVGLGVLSKYTIALPVLSLLVALLVLPSQRHHLRSRWFWSAALLAALIAAPNLLWLARHHFVTLRMEHSIHIRDVALGRADGFFMDQVKLTLLALPLALAGLVALLRNMRMRLLSAFYLGPLVLLAVTKGRGYYLLPGYTVLYAAGAVALQGLLRHRSATLRYALYAVAVCALSTGTLAVAWAYLPIWPVHSAAWNWQMRNNYDMANEIGWPAFVAQVAAVRDALPAQDRASLAVLADNYGEAGALALYGPKYGLPTPISTVNSFWARGFGSPAETVIITGSSLEDQHHFADCHVGGQVSIPYGVRNEESVDHPEILVCHHLLRPWSQVWSREESFG